jgi:hypothetical protein
MAFNRDSLSPVSGDSQSGLRPHDEFSYRKGYREGFLEVLDALDHILDLDPDLYNHGLDFWETTLYAWVHAEAGAWPEFPPAWDPPQPKGAGR